MGSPATARVQRFGVIPWALHVEAWEVYNDKWNSGRRASGQSAERIAERGGFGIGEMDEFVPGWRQRVHNG